MNERYKVYNPDVLTKNIINQLIDKGIRFDIVPDLEPEEYDDPYIEIKEEEPKDGAKSIIGSVF